MEIGVSLDQGLRLPFDQQRELVKEAAQLGYTSAWTPAGLSTDAFQICSQWFTASPLKTGTAVVPVGVWTPPALAACAGTTGLITGGRFILGIGSGGVYGEAYRRTFNLPPIKPIALMRDYLITLRRLLAGEVVTYEGPVITLRGVQLGFRPPRVPVYLGALGPQMLRLAGAEADGVSLNWCTPEQIAWSRERVAEGARKAGRDAAEVKLAEYIRICVDEDEEVARRAYTRAVMGYALARPGASKDAAYRGHFGRMGFHEALCEIEDRRDAGTPEDELIDAFPRELLKKVGYYGPAAGARDAFLNLATGLDEAIVRVVAARPGVDSVRAVMQACAPSAGAAG